MDMEQQSANGSKMSDDDAVSRCIGERGKWQFGVSVLMAFLKFMLAWTQFGIIFLAPPQDFECLHTTLSNETLTGKNLCSIQHDNGTQSQCDSFTYDTSIFKSTIVTEWNLVCSRAFFVEFTQMSFMTGFLVGSLVFGILSDKYGRRRPLLVAIILQTLTGFGVALAPWYWMFILARLITAVAVGGVSVISFVMCLEAFGGKWRTVAPILYHAPLGIGNALMTAMAYVLRDWRNLQLSMSVLSTFYLLYVWLLPESPRWLLATGRNKEAIRVLERAAMINGRDPNIVKSIVSEKRELAKLDKKYSFKLLFSDKDFKVKTTILSFLWFGTGVCLFAFVQYVGKISDNIFITTAVVGLNVIPGLPLCVYLAGRCRRRIFMMSSLMAVSCCFAAILVTPRGVFVHDWPRIVFSGMGIIGIDVFIPTLYLYTGEVYPTVLRNAAVGLLTLVSRIGSIVAPLVLSLDRISYHLPLAVLAAITSLLCVALIPLPETKDVPLAKEDERKMDASSTKRTLGNVTYEKVAGGGGIE